MNPETMPYHEKRPWGSFSTFALNELSTVKIITVESGQAFSLQKHQQRAEEWYIISGVGLITIDTTTEALVVGNTYHIPQETLHRIEATTEAVVLLEISRGTFIENDITRVDDRYGRA
jgi:mannose-6-phosphate isomerase-like protein (cupin superfamily)